MGAEGCTIARIADSAQRYFLLFMEISFLGWAVETIFFFLCYGSFHDRGFMTLPFCTIYGCSFLLLYFLVGAPTAGGGRAIAYFALCAILPTALELLTGWFFHRLFDIRLWSYESYRFQLHGYICLEYALIWGVLIPPCMKYIVVPMQRRIAAMDAVRVRALSSALAVLSCVDWAVNFSRL